jgi:hypothetical protein
VLGLVCDVWECLFEIRIHFGQILGKFASLNHVFAAIELVLAHTLFNAAHSDLDVVFIFESPSV